MLRRTEHDGTREVLELVMPRKIGRRRTTLGWQAEADRDMVRVGI